MNAQLCFTTTLQVDSNLYVVYQAGYTNGSGRWNVFSGCQAGWSNTTGSNNTFTGFQAGTYNTSGAYNVFTGTDAGQANTSGSNNVFTGFEAGYSNTYGGDNVFTGFNAGYSNTTGTRNVFTGRSAGGENTTGSYNTFIGPSTGQANTSGSNNVFIGWCAGFTNETGSNKLFINSGLINSPLIYGDFDYKYLVINGDSSDNSGNLTLFVNGSSGGTSAWTNSSDRRLKTHIQTLPNALDKVLKLRGVTYQWKDGREKGERIGFIAQEVESILPEVVDNQNDHYTMQYAPVTALLVEAVKIQQAQIDQLKAENELLKAQVAKIDQIEAMLEQIQTSTLIPLQNKMGKK